METESKEIFQHRLKKAAVVFDRPGVAGAGLQTAS